MIHKDSSLRLRPLLWMLVALVWGSSLLACTGSDCPNDCPQGSICRDGVCTSLCDFGKSLCFDRCIDTNTNLFHCGACNRICPGGTECKGGDCVPFCRGSSSLCGKTCVLTQTDSNHCGRCGNQCKEGERCIEGICQNACKQGLTWCAEACINTQTDDKHCGRCGNKCPGGVECKQGKCTDGSCNGDSDCSGDEKCIYGRCVALPGAPGEGQECALSGQKCDSGLTCFGLKEDPTKGICFRRCEQNPNVCTDGRSCAAVGQYSLCLNLVGEGEDCNVRKLIGCKQGLVCDEKTKKCKAVPKEPLKRCGETPQSVCTNNDEVCIRLNPKVSYGYCSVKCDPTNDSCDANQKLKCIPLQGGTVIKGVCLQLCKEDKDCSGGWTCQTLQSGTQICKP